MLEIYHIALNIRDNIRYYILNKPKVEYNNQVIKYQ